MTKTKKPPMKALEQIKNYCEKTQCRSCVFGDTYNNGYVGCILLEKAPCDWDIKKEEET